MTPQVASLRRFSLMRRESHFVVVFVAARTGSRRASGVGKPAPRSGLGLRPRGAKPNSGTRHCADGWRTTSWWDARSTRRGRPVVAIGLHMPIAGPLEASRGRGCSMRWFGLRQPESERAKAGSKPASNDRPSRPRPKMDSLGVCRTFALRRVVAPPACRSEDIPNWAVVIRLSPPAAVLPVTGAAHRVRSTAVPDDVLSRIRELLRSAGIAFREIQHAPTRTSEESAHARGEELKVGGKALVLKIDETFGLFVLSAARKLDSGAIKQYFGTKKSRFATGEELLRMTGLTPGAVPPFGRPVLPFDLFVDGSILENDRIAFNAGSLTTSIIMSIEDYMRVAQPTVFNFSR